MLYFILLILHFTIFTALDTIQDTYWIRFQFEMWERTLIPILWLDLDHFLLLIDYKNKSEAKK